MSLEGPDVLIVDRAGTARPPARGDDPRGCWEGSAGLFANTVRVRGERWLVAYRFDRQPWDVEQEGALRRLASAETFVVFIEHENENHARARVLRTAVMSDAAIAVAAVKVIAGWLEDAVLVDLYGVTHEVELQHGGSGWVVANLQRSVRVRPSDVEPLSEASLRSAYEPPGHRVSIHTYEPGTRFDGTGRTGRLYVLSGTCGLGFDSQTVLVRAGQMVAVPEGDHALAVASDVPCQVANIWDLAELAPQLLDGPSNV